MTTESRNHLSAEKSPYLLQHQNNPVHWYPWGQEAFDAAGREDKPIFLSIGYSTCYWCHVMEHDSFERQDVADVLNRDFICIKVDREERPDVDHIYMDVVVAMHGHGGWPMSVFLTPDRKPFWGGTFFWRQQFLQVLQGVQKAWSRDRDKVISSAEQITEAVADREISSGAGAASKQILEEAAHKLHSSYDPRFGGFGPAPKFPPTQQLRFLLRWHRRKEDSSALEMATHTVDCMIRGGLYDHIGGGFARYSTDERWLVPHFEKMLYDNALLAETLVEMYQVTGKEYLAATLKELLDFVAREMRSAEGGFLSAIDAGEVDKEGEFYVWKLDELERLLTPDELAWTRHLFDITEAGNFEGQANVLSLRPDCPWEDRFSRRTELLREKLLAARSTRRNPHVDDKCLASWNGLMIGAFAKAARVLKVDRYLQIAEEAAAFIKDSLLSEGKLSRRFREGAVLPYAFVDDYAYVISGLLALYESNFDEEILLWAKSLQAEFDALLWDESKSLYRTSAAPELIVQKFELFDGATPSANSVAYGNLMRLSGYFPEDRFDLKADRVGKALAAVASQYPHGFSRFLIELDFALPPMREIAIIIRPDERFEQNDLVQLLWRKFIPGKIVAVAHAQRKSAVPILQTRELLSGRAAAYVCRGQQCELPVSSAAELERMLALDTPERGNPDRGNPARGDRA